MSSSLPSSYNDGAEWGGKGLTQSIVAGARGGIGPLSVVFAPVAIWSQNLSFGLQPNGLDASRSFVNPIASIDLPQRFGPGSLTRIDLGQSTAELRVWRVSGGVTTANEIWGPAIESPLILGNNAPGIPRLFVGTSSPIRWWAGTVESRVFWGRSTLSPYANGSFGGSRKFATGAVGAFSPRWISGLSLGAARFFHLSSNSSLPPRFFSRVFQGLLQTSLASEGNAIGDDPTDNQLASIFFRWMLPGRGFEVFGEFGREDTSYDLRDLTLQLYHDAAYMVGLQRVWKSTDSLRYTVFRAEVLNTRMGPLYQGAPQVPWYTHDEKGHTERGQALGSPFAPGGGSAFFAVTRYTAKGSTRVRAGRGMLREVLTAKQAPLPDRASVLGLLELERMAFGSGNRPDLAGNFRVEWFRNRVGGPSFNVTTGFSAYVLR